MDFDLCWEGLDWLGWLCGVERMVNFSWLVSYAAAKLYDTIDYGKTCLQ
jgi:hypothetical protein